MKKQVPRNSISAVPWYLVLGIWLLGLSICSAQQSKIDSLLSILKTAQEDTGKVNHLNLLSREYTNIGSYDSSIAFANTSLKLSQQLNPPYKKGIANAYNNIGNAYKEQSDYPKALGYFFKALKIDEELKDKSGIGKRLGNIGNIYKEQSDYSKALDYYFKALKIGEELGDKKGIATRLGNIGNVYASQAEHPKVQPVERDSLLNKALDYYLKALKLDEELDRNDSIGGNKNGIARHLGNIGLIYWNQNDYNKALDYYFMALKMKEKLGNKNEVAITLGNIGSLYTEQKKYKEAESYLLKALAIDTTTGHFLHAEFIQEELCSFYEKIKNYKLALLYYKKAMVLKDTLFSEEKNKEITRKEMNYEFEKKEAAAVAAAEKQQAVANAEKQRQRIVLILVSCVLLLVVVFAMFIFRALRITQKQKQLIELQKKMVEEKQNEILASIRYAKRIQDALLPTEKYIDKTLKRLMKNN